MPIEKSEDEVKKPDDATPPPAEAILADTQQRDSDEAISAEQSIRNFVRDRIGEWHEQMEGALDTFESWIYSHTEEQQAMFSDRGYFDFFGDGLIGELQRLAGGAGTPIMDAVVGEVYNTVSFAQHSEFEIGLFMTQCRRGVRDACWYLRDNSQSILDKQWPDLLKLAYEGSYDFVPMLHALGLPSLSFKPTEFSSNLVTRSEEYQRAVEPTRQAVAEQAPSNEKQQEIQQESQLLDMASGDKQAQPLAM